MIPQPYRPAPKPYRALAFRSVAAALAVFAAFAAAHASRATAQQSPQAPPAGDSRQIVPPGYSTTRTGTMHDFDYFQGGWTTHQHRLKARGVGSNDWEDFSANLCMCLYLDGLATVDEMYIPSKNISGLTLRTFDKEKRQWSIYWVSSVTGRFDPDPVMGGFDGHHGEFYGEDHENGRPIKVRFLWTIVDHDHARWEQAFSFDNRTWETNWTADFTRADPAAVCVNGRPKR